MTRAILLGLLVAGVFSLHDPKRTFPMVLDRQNLGQVATFSAEFYELNPPRPGASLLAIVSDPLEALVTNSLWLVPISSSNLD